MAVDVAEQKIDAIQEEEEEVEEEEVDEEYEEAEEEPEEEPEEEGGGGSEAEHRAGDYTEAAAAVTADGADVAVEEAKQSNPASSSSSSEGKIFVGGVSRETTEDNFTKHFEKYGIITDSVIMKDKHTLAPRGFGFVTFADPSVIDKVLADKHVLDGKPVEVKRTVPREDKASKGGIKTKKIFVGGILPTLTEDEFKQHFATYGKVIEHQIMMDHSTGRSRGFGFITFENEDAVEKIISEGKMHDLGGKQVEIKKAEPRKAGADPGFSGRVAYGAAGGGNPLGMLGGGAYGYGGGYQSGVAYYGGRGGGYGYGGAVGYGAGYAPNVGGPMYAAGGYAAGNGYGGQGAYGAYNGYGAGRGSTGRYHPYGR